MPDPRDPRWNDPDLDAREHFAVLAGASSRVLAAGWNAFWMALACLFLGVGVGWSAHHVEATRAVVTPPNSASEALALVHRALDSERARAEAASARAEATNARAESERRRADEANTRAENERRHADEATLRAQASQSPPLAQSAPVVDAAQVAALQTELAAENAARLRAEQTVLMTRQQCAMLVGGVLQGRVVGMPVRTFPWGMMPMPARSSLPSLDAAEAP